MNDFRKKRKVRRFGSNTAFNVGLYHMNRWGGTKQNLRRKLERRAHESREEHGGEEEEHTQWIEAALLRLENSGAINDKKYASDKAKSLSSRGQSPRIIQNKLRLKGVPPVLIDLALAELNRMGDPTVKAGATWLRKRRLGAYAIDERLSPQKVLKRMARAGFPYAVSKSLLDVEDEGTLLDLENGVLELGDVQ